MFSPEITGQATVAGAGVPYTEFVRLVDDTGVMSFQVPTAFVDVSTVPLTLDGYGTVPVIAVAENLATAFGSSAEAYSGNGAALVAFTDPNLDMTLVYVAARLPGESRFIVLGIQAVDEAMIDAVATILNSFRWER